MATGARAQVLYFQVFFDAGYSETQAECGGVAEQADFYLAALNINNFVGGVEYKVMFPPEVLFLFDTLPANTLSLGSNSQTGMAQSFTDAPRNGFDPLLLSTMRVIWANCHCGTGPKPIVVTGWTEGPGGNQAPIAITWPDYSQVPGVGMTSVICPGAVSTSESTWGGIKALYR
jgi:hypothetical protein